MAAEALGARRALTVGGRVGLVVVAWAWTLPGAWQLLRVKDVLHEPRQVSPGLTTGLGADAHAYWHAWSQHLYQFDPHVMLDRFLYTPAFAQVFWPLAQLPWRPFVAVWTAAVLAGFVWLLWPLPWYWAVPFFFEFCWHDVLLGNINVLLAVDLVVGLRRPAVGAFPLLTKIAPGVWLAWFAARGEWRRLAVPAVVAAGIGAVSFAVSPGLWVDWWRLLTSGQVDDSHVLWRLLAALLLTVVAARLDRPWLLTPVLLLAAPVVGPSTFSLLAVGPRLWQRHSERGAPLDRRVMVGDLCG